MKGGAEGTSVNVTLQRPAVASTTTTTTGEAAAAGSTSTTTTTTDTGPVDLSRLPSGSETKEYTLTRRNIEIPVTDTKIVEAGDKKVAVIGFYTFSQGSAAALRSAVKQAVEVEQVDAVVLDLRGNGGGLLNEGVDVASIFIPDGEIVSTEGLHSPKQVYDATGSAYPDVPLYVLTDPYTASASEIVAGALQDYKRATLVGETTFGKGLVQSIEPLSNGGALKATTAVYLTPLGRDINKKGIIPNVLAPDDPATAGVDETLQAVLKLIASASPTSTTTTSSTTTSSTMPVSTTGPFTTR
jgi:carboxyl-terminal processing protease